MKPIGAKLVGVRRIHCDSAQHSKVIKTLENECSVCYYENEKWFPMQGTSLYTIDVFNAVNENGSVFRSFATEKRLFKLGTIPCTDSTMSSIEKLFIEEGLFVIGYLDIEKDMQRFVDVYRLIDQRCERGYSLESAGTISNLTCSNAIPFEDSVKSVIEQGLWIWIPTTNPLSVAHAYSCAITSVAREWAKYLGDGKRLPSGEYLKFIKKICVFDYEYTDGGYEAIAEIYQRIGYYTNIDHHHQDKGISSLITFQKVTSPFNDANTSVEKQDSKLDEQLEQAFEKIANAEQYPKPSLTKDQIQHVANVLRGMASTRRKRAKIGGEGHLLPAQILEDAATELIAYYNLSNPNDIIPYKKEK